MRPHIAGRSEVSSELKAGGTNYLAGVHIATHAIANVQVGTQKYAPQRLKFNCAHYWRTKVSLLATLPSLLCKTVTSKV